MDRLPHVVGVGGTTRGGSSTERALRFALRVCEEKGVATTCFAGSELGELPMYAPERSERAPAAVRLTEALRSADGIIIASSSYHGSVSGLVKNALDYVEDLREDARPYLAGLPVGCIATGAGWQGVVCTLEHIRSIAHALRGWPTPMGAAINTATPVLDAAGEPTDHRTRFQLETVAVETVSFIRLANPA